MKRVRARQDSNLQPGGTNHTLYPLSYGRSRRRPRGFSPLGRPLCATFYPRVVRFLQSQHLVVVMLATTTSCG